MGMEFMFDLLLSAVLTITSMGQKLEENTLHNQGTVQFWKISSVICSMLYAASVIFFPIFFILFVVRKPIKSVPLKFKDMFDGLRAK